MDTERFLEEIRLYPFLYDKTMPDYKDKQAKMNTWDIIGSMFGLTGTQAMMKFKNIRDWWMKLVSGVEANTRSGAPGNHGKIKWPLFAISDGMLRQTPHYAEKPTGKPTDFAPSRKRKTRSEDVDASIKDLLGSCSTSIQAIAKKKEALQPDECDIAGSLVAVKLKALPKRKRSQRAIEANMWVTFFVDETSTDKIIFSKYQVQDEAAVDLPREPRRGGLVAKTGKQCVGLSFSISVPPKRMHPISSRRISRAATLKQQQTSHHGNVERCEEIVVAGHCSHDCTVKWESKEQTTKKRAKSREPLRDRSRLLSRDYRRCGQRAAFHRSAAKTRVMPRRHASR
ncbi:hypothetical protein HPB51_027724 [Rhipicephalus microplus]|uniref:MADF domain-containing protein n=1 Tax=Rhipicephalus microplus TaxID=6941 RepID=A0A9J6CZC1_RHIMP|nr:hypothetical protein HPB51_027724 [Rhipicephalus microplus]